MTENKYQETLISIIIPCCDEEKFIAKLLDSILTQDYPKDRIEVLIIDGLSDDRTRSIIKEYVRRYSFIRMLDNVKRIVPIALNIGIRESKGDIIIRMDAHSSFPSDYVSKCVKYLNEHKVDNVGGVVDNVEGLWVTLSVENSVKAKAIAIALSSPFGVGNSYFRIGIKEPKFVDTVPFGCYRREVFDRIGLFNENLVRNQDIEFNLRLKKAGGKILLVPDIISYYYARSNLRGLFSNNFLNGFWVIYSMKFAKLPFSIRHLVPLAFLGTLILGLILSFFYFKLFYLFIFVLGLYLLFNISISLLIAFKNGLKYFPFLIISFLTLHFSYGFGSLWGSVKLLARKT